MFNVAIVGGEGSGDYPTFKEKCIFYLKNKAGEGIKIYTTGDEYVDAFADRYRIDTIKFHTDFKKYGKDALKVRNEEMLENCDALIYFNDGTKDTKMILKMAKDLNIPVRIIN